MQFIRKRKNRSRNGRAEKYGGLEGKTPLLRGGVLAKIFMVVVFVLVAVIILPPTQHIKRIELRAGEISDRDIIAPFDFQIPRSQKELEFARMQKAMSVPPVYVRDKELEAELSGSLTSFFDSLYAIVSRDTLSEHEKLEKINALLPYVPANASRVLLDRRRLASIRKQALGFQKRTLERGLIDNSEPLRRGEPKFITVLDGNEEKRSQVKDIIDQGRLDQMIREAGLSTFKRDRNSADVFYEIVRMHLLPNLLLDVGETQKRRNEAMNKVPRFIEMSKKQKIVGKYDRVTEQQVRALRAMEVARASHRVKNSPLVVLGMYSAEVLRVLLIMGFFFLYVLIFNRSIFDDLLKMGSLLVVLLVYLVSMAVVSRFSLNPYLIPVPFVSLMFGALFGLGLGIIGSVVAAVLIPALTPIHFGVSFVSLMAGLTAAVSVERLSSRSQFYRIFLYVSAAYLVGVLSVDLGQVEDSSALFVDIGWGVADSFLATVVVMFLLPVYESVLNLTTKFTLFELTDLNKPILKRLNMEAHGTYHHSMLIANMVSSVAAAAGADPLRVRVMAYYHDIGKILQPEYFSENQDLGVNKHDKLTPKLSSVILLSHVKDGVELAREEKLPEVVVDAIREHHGTTVMAFFYQKALETDSHSSVSKDDFRYPGPRPRSKESAILMLADTVEPACRSLKEPTPTHIRNMVSKLIEMRLKEGELDDSNLTLKDLAVIREKFVSILTGMYHKRVAYPGQEKEERKAGEIVSKPAG